MKIEQIFPSARNNWDTLYVQFALESSVQTLYKYARNLQKNQRTKELYPMFRELQSISCDLKYRTQVKIVDSNLVLFKRKPNENLWSEVMTDQVHLPKAYPTNSVQLNLRLPTHSVIHQPGLVKREVIYQQNGSVY